MQYSLNAAPWRSRCRPRGINFGSLQLSPSPYLNVRLIRTQQFFNRLANFSGSFIRCRFRRLADRRRSHPAHRHAARSPRDLESVVQCPLLQFLDQDYPVRVGAHRRHRQRAGRQRPPAPEKIKARGELGSNRPKVQHVDPRCLTPRQLAGKQDWSKRQGLTEADQIQH